MASPADPPVSVTGARSRLTRPGRFLSDWWHDTARAPRFAWQLFRRVLNIQFRHSSLGILLAFLPATITALVFAYARRTHLFSDDSGGVNSAFYGGFGVLLAQAFVEAFNAGRRLFVANQGIFRRNVTSVEGPLLATLFEVLFHDAIRIVVMAGLMAAFRVLPSAALPLAIWGLLGVSLGGVGIGFLLAAPNALQPDLNALAAGLPIALFTATPVFLIPPPGSLLGRIHAANPLSWLFDGIRAAAYGGPGSLTGAAVGPLVAAVFLLAGWGLCRVALPHIVERLPG